MTNNPKDFFEEVLSDVKKLKKKHKSKKINISKNIVKNKSIKEILESKEIKATKEKSAKNKYENLQILKLQKRKLIIEDGKDFYKKIKKRKIKINKKLDLHGLTLKEAEKIFDDEIHSSYFLGKRCLLIITGKGIREQNNNYGTPILYYGKIRKEIKKWIKKKINSEKILYFTQAGPEHGGDGSFYIYLRKK